jgi:hypothetical protein
VVAALAGSATATGHCVLYIEVAIFVAERLEYIELQHVTIVWRAQMLEHEIYSAAASREAYEAYREQSNVAAQLELIEVFDGVHWHKHDDKGTVQQQHLQEPHSYNSASGSGEVCTATFYQLCQFRAHSISNALSALCSLCAQ